MSIESVKKYLTIEDVGTSKSGLTRIWTITGRDGGIGVIQWHGPWRKYVYFSDEAFYDWDCLRYIAEFCETATKDHNSKHGKNKLPGRTE